MKRILAKLSPYCVVSAIILIYIVILVIDYTRELNTMRPIVGLAFLVTIILLWYEGKLLGKLSFVRKNRIHPIINKVFKEILPSPFVIFIYMIVLLVSLIFYSKKFERVTKQLTTRPSIKTPIELIREAPIHYAEFVEGAQYIRYDGLRPEMRVVVDSIKKIKKVSFSIKKEGSNKSSDFSKWCEIKVDTIIIRPQVDLSPEIHYAKIEVIGSYGQKGAEIWTFMPTLYIDFYNSKTTFKQEPPGTWQFSNGEVIGERWHPKVLPTFLKIQEGWLQKHIVIEADCYFTKIDKPRPGGIGFYLPGGYVCIFRDGSLDKVVIRRWSPAAEPVCIAKYLPTFKTNYLYTLKAKKTEGEITCFVNDIPVARWKDYRPVEGERGVALGVWNTIGHFRRVRIFCPPEWER